MTGASVAAMPAGMPRLTNQEPSGSDRLVAAKAEEAKPTSVMATWMVARNWPESEERSRALLARLSPSSASGSSTALLALTTAISEAEK